MISIIEEKVPDIFTVWHHSPLMNYVEGTCLACHKIKIEALQSAKEYLQLDINDLERKINAITNKTTTTELSKDTSSTD